MGTYILRRLLGAVVVLWGVSVLIFLMVHLTPGDPAVIMLDVRADAASVERLREQMGLNDPMYVQYYNFAINALQGDLGRSFRTNRLVSNEIRTRVWPTLQLTLTGMLIAVTLGVTAGVAAAANRNTWIESSVMVVATIGVSIPNFVTGMLLILFFGVHLGWLPSTGFGTIRHLIMPAVSLGFLYSTIIARMVRSSMVEVLDQDYVRTARSKGLSQRVILYKHALRNGLIPVVTIVGVYFGLLLAGAVVVEQLFAWPGLGRLAVLSIMTRDFPLTQGVVLFVATILVFVNLLVDLTYAFIDPRIKYQ